MHTALPTFAHTEPPAKGDALMSALTYYAQDTQQQLPERRKNQQQPTKADKPLKTGAGFLKWYLLTVLHLLFMGAVGAILMLVVGIIAFTGILTTVFFGLGLVLLFFLFYIVFVLALFEHARISGLYERQVLRVAWPPRRKPGFEGWLDNYLQACTNSAVWRSFASFIAASFLGLIMLEAIWMLSRHVSFLIAAFTTHKSQIAEAKPPVHIILILLSILIIIGAAPLHKIITNALLITPVAQSQLQDAADVSRARVRHSLSAAEFERTRIERDLHDTVQPQLVSVAMTLGLAQATLQTSPEAAHKLIGEAHSATKTAIAQLRQLVRGIHASVLVDRGLDPALSALAASLPVPCEIEYRLPPRLDKDIETALYFTIAEALTNAAKYAQAERIRVVLWQEGSLIKTSVFDNGIGGARVLAGGGLDGVVNRLGALGGTIQVTSPVGGPTMIEVMLPCES